MRSKQIKTFYHPSQVLQKGGYSNYSKSPLKPKLLIEYLEKKSLLSNFSLTKSFNRFGNSDFEIAHTRDYVRDFFRGGPKSSSNGLGWNPQFADSVRYTNSSLYSAIRNSVVNPQEVSFSPTSGFHHARPDGGSGFCTFSGQVIASVKIWREFGISGCYLDLDGHFGNSIEDTRGFQPDLNSAVPRGFNFNPSGYDETYYKDLAVFLEELLAPAVMSGRIGYVVWCHGADSHEDDQLGSQCSTEWWVKCSTLFWSWVKKMDAGLGRPLPVSCALFGGYRDDDYNSVLSLHTADFVECLNELLELGVKYKIEVVPQKKFGQYARSSRRELEESEGFGKERNRFALLARDFGSD